MSVIAPQLEKDELKVAKAPIPPPLPPDTKPQPIIESDSDFEQMDRGMGWEIDDEPTYHRTEK